MINQNDIDYWKQQRLIAWEDYFYWAKREETAKSRYERNSFHKQRWQAGKKAKRYDGLIYHAYAAQVFN